jgi:lysophospholipid acyltransferase (LPLAT)-like uncharacterized protein
MLRWLKQWTKTDSAQRLACWLGAWYLRTAYATGRWQVDGDETAKRLWREHQPFILCFWHGRLLMMPFAWNPPEGARGAPINMLISAHHDGRIIARAVGHFGIDTVAGSDGNAMAAMRTLVRTVRAGRCIGITPDSPPGPRMRAKPGVAVLARLAQVPVIPATYSIERRKVLKSWDRLVIPKWFSRGVFLWGSPIKVAADADDAALDQARQQIEDALTALSAEADHRCGHAAIEPGPPLAGFDPIAARHAARAAG